MKSAEEWLSGIDFDWDETVSKRLIEAIQKDAFDAGVVEGMHKAGKIKKPPEYPDQLDILNSL